MRVTHVSTNDLRGGAARAAYRLHCALKSGATESQMFVRHKLSADDDVLEYSIDEGMFSKAKSILINQLILLKASKYRKSIPDGLELFSSPKSRYRDAMNKYISESDVINLHWVAGFIDYNTFFRNLSGNKKIVWTLHDMHPLTGGCHYSGNCNRYRESCGKCPQLGSFKSNDLSRENWLLKNNAINGYYNNKIHIVSPSKWLAEKANESSIFRYSSVTVIPNGIDTNIFRPRKCAELREALSIDDTFLVVGFVSDNTNNKRKGLSLLQAALEKINYKNILIVSLGKHIPLINSEENHIHLGNVDNDVILSTIYSLFDIYICPSMEDNFPNTVIESLSCGTPVMGFNIGGLPEIIEHGRTGFIVNDVSVSGLKKCLEEIRDDKRSLDLMSSDCRKKAGSFYTSRMQAKSYEKLYNSLY